MTKIINTHIGPNGILTVPLDQSDANKPVRVIVETLEEAKTPMDRAAWLRFIERTAGSIGDSSFERPPQGEHENRDPLA